MNMISIWESYLCNYLVNFLKKDWKFCLISGPSRSRRKLRRRRMTMMTALTGVLIQMTRPLPRMEMLAYTLWGKVLSFAGRVSQFCWTEIGSWIFQLSIFKYLIMLRRGKIQVIMLEMIPFPFIYREHFLKKTTDREEDDSKKKRRKKPAETKIKEEDSDDDEGGWETVKKGSSMPMVGSYDPRFWCWLK